MGFRQGDQVVYGIHGVCRVVDIEKKTVDRKQVEYYVLQPSTHAEATYYVPVHNEAAVAKMRKMLTAAELNALLESEEILADCWISDENQRKDRYRKLIARADCAELIGMIRSLHLHKQRQLEAGKKFHLCDDNFLKDAQRLITAEVSQILNIQPGEVEGYIRSRLEK